MPDVENIGLTNDQSNGSCPECGAVGVAGRAGCEALFEEFRFQALHDPRIGAVHWLAFDTYCMQHVDTYCQSAKSYAAHLMRLCCGVDFKGNLDIYAAIPRWLDGLVTLEKPAILTHRGDVTFADVWGAETVEDEIERVMKWAGHVWAAYTSQHALARQWIHKAIAHQSGH